MTAIFLASIAVTLAVGGWAGIRYAQAAYELDADLTRYLVSIPASAWQEDGDE